jgi:hypothetical protein
MHSRIGPDLGLRLDVDGLVPGKLSRHNICKNILRLGISTSKSMSR